MAQIIYRVSGLDTTGHRISQRFRDTDEDRAAAKSFAAALKMPRTVYDVRIRVAGKVNTKTFARRKDADAYVTGTEADKLRGVVIDPRRARISLKDYADGWLAGRHDLAQRTAELYRYLLDVHIFPTLGSVTLGGITPSAVRSWHAGIAKDHPTTAAKAYRLLRSILTVAVADEVIARNPCQVKGAGQENAPERKIATVAEVQALADAMPAHLRIAVLLAAWCQLRRGELLGLRRRDVDLLHWRLTVENSRTTARGGAILEKAPKSEAGIRTLSIPPNIRDALSDHLAMYVAPEPDALVLVGKKGGALIPGVLQVAWEKARTKVGRPDLHVHDLRHTGATLAATTGATTKELMHRLGHSSPAAALRYQHATEKRDEVLGEALATLAQQTAVIPLQARRPRVG